jgi:transposase
VSKPVTTAFDRAAARVTEYEGTSRNLVTASTRQDWFEKQSTTFERRSPMSEITRVGVDLAKHVIQIHAVDARDQLVTNRTLPRDKFLSWCLQLPAGCKIAMEACSSAHHWARKLQALGFDVRIIAAHLVAPYRLQGKGGKNDANDAAAICEAASRPSMRFVPIKSLAQQGMLCVHRLREGLKEERTACINRIRGLLAEFGIVIKQSPEALREVLADVIEDANNDLAGIARLVIDQARAHWLELDARLKWCDQRLAAHLKDDEQVQAGEKIIGIGPVTASAVVATVGDFKQFKNGAQFGAWLGLTPRQNSSGGKTRLGGITKRGDRYLRTLLIQAAKSAVMSAHKRDDPISQWVLKLKEKSGWQKAVVALANKNARILWAVMVKGQAFNARHVSVKPGSTVSQASPALCVAA